MSQPIKTFIDKWSESEAWEWTDKGTILVELYDVLEVERPGPATGNPKQNVLGAPVRFPGKVNTPLGSARCDDERRP